MEKLVLPEKNVEVKRSRTIAIASGKGGVGKTVITANLAIFLAQKIRQEKGSVVAIALDPGCGNLNACLGVRSSNGNINNFLLNQETSLRGILTPTQQENLQMICSSYSGFPQINLSHYQRKQLLAEVSNFDADFVLMDLGAGTSTDVLDLFLGASERIVVITPESLSLHNAFVFLKAAILHLLGREVEQRPSLSTVRQSWRQAIDDPEHLQIPKFIEQIKLWDVQAAHILADLINNLQIKFVVNKYRGGVENSHLKKFHHLLCRYLWPRTEISYLGLVHFDFALARSTQAIKPFLLNYPDSPAARDIREVADRLAGTTTASLEILMSQQQKQPIVENLRERLSEKVPLAREELPPTVGREKGYVRRVAVVVGCLLMILMVSWWYQFGLLPGGAQEQSTPRQRQQQEQNETEGSLPIVSEAGLLPVVFAKFAESEDQDGFVRITNTNQGAPVSLEPSPDSLVSADELIKDKPAHAEPTGLLDSPLSDRYTIQVGAFSTQASAKRTLSQLSAKGYSGRIEQPETGKDGYYYVWAGQFTSSAQALPTQAKLRTDGFETYIKKVAGH